MTLTVREVFFWIAHLQDSSICKEWTILPFSCFITHFFLILVWRYFDPRCMYWKSPVWVAHLVRDLTLTLYKVKWVNWWIQKLMLFPCNCLITYLNLCWYEMPWPKMHVFVKFCWDSSLGYSSGLINFKRMKNCSHFLVWLHIWKIFFNWMMILWSQMQILI